MERRSPNAYSTISPRGPTSSSWLTSGADAPLEAAGPLDAIAARGTWPVVSGSVRERPNTSRTRAPAAHSVPASLSTPVMTARVGHIAHQYWWPVAALIANSEADVITAPARLRRNL